MTAHIPRIINLFPWPNDKVRSRKYSHCHSNTGLFFPAGMPWGVEWVIAGHCHRPGSTEAQKSFNYLPPTTITCQPPVDMTPMKWQINRNVQIQIPQKARVVLEPDFTLYLFKNNLMHLSYTILYLLMSTTVPSWSASSQLNIHRIPLFHKQ